MAETLPHRGRTVAAAETRHLAISRLSHCAKDGEPPFCFSGGADNAVLFTDGFFLYPEGAPNAASDSLLRLIEGGNPDDILPLLPGAFCLALYFPDSRRLMLYRSWPGSIPLYYAKFPGGLAFATEIKALLRHPLIAAVPNDPMLAQLALSEPDGLTGTTCFIGIESLAPGAALFIGPARTEIRPVQIFPLYPESHGSRDKTICRFRQLLSNSLRICMPDEKICYEVSGGLDSTTLFCLGNSSNRSLDNPTRHQGVFHYAAAFPEANEKSYVDSLSGRNLPPVRAVPSLTEGMDNAVQQIVRRCEMPVIDGLFPTFESIYEKVAGNGCRLLVSGLFGDQVLFNLDYLETMALKGQWLALRRHLNSLQEYNRDVPNGIFLRRLLRSLAVRAVPAALRSPMRRLLGKTPSGKPYTAAFASSALSRRQRQNRTWPGCHKNSASLQFLLESVKFRQALEYNEKLSAWHGIRNHYPYLDPAVLSFILQLPGETINLNGLPKGLLRAAGENMVPDEIRLRQSKGDYTRVVQKTVATSLDPILCQTFQESSIVCCGYARKNILLGHLDKLRNNLESGNATGAWELCRIIALELWLKEFIL